jgi:hypothetical protein
MAHRFSKEQKEQRAADKAQRERDLDESILTRAIELGIPAGHSLSSWTVDLDGIPIAVVILERDSDVVTVLLIDGNGTQVDLQNVDECKSLLTYRKIAAANMFPGGAVNLANMVLQRDAEAEAEKLRAVTNAPTGGRQICRL